MHQINKVKKELDEEIAWRYKELKNIERLYIAHLTNKQVQIGSQTKQISKNTRESKYILRSSIPLIYAHWEGFFKKSIELLHKELDLLSLDYNKLDNAILSILTKDKHTIKYKEGQFKFSEILIDTKSNLSWDVVEKFCNRYNFDIKKFDKYKSLIEQLLKIRNGISHGENAYHFDDISKINEFTYLAMRLMIITKLSVLNFLEYKKYYK